MAPRKTAGSTQELCVDGIRVVVSRKRVRNINLRVRPDGTVALSAAPSVPLKDIEALVRARRDWICVAQARLADARQVAESRCDDGAGLVLWGEPLVVRVVPVPASGRWPHATFSHEGPVLVARVDERIAGSDDEGRAARERLLDQWLREELERRVEQMLPACEQTVGRWCSAWKLRHMTSRWGSCNTATGAITLSTELVHHPPRCLAYVITHELCHLHEPSHNARFHALMDRFYPTWRAVRAELNGR